MASKALWQGEVEEQWQHMGMSKYKALVCSVPSGMGAGTLLATFAK